MLLPTFSFLLLLGAALQAGENCCDQCGCPCTCQKVCRLVCENRDVVKFTYGCKSVDFCVPGPSTRCKNECNCGHCDQCNNCNSYSKYTWTAGCGEVRTKKVLEKYAQHCTKPTYRWVVEYLCPNCSYNAGK
jgi:hypothetical protein